MHNINPLLNNVANHFKNEVHPGDQQKILTILSYHYDAILRDIAQENPDEASYFTAVLEDLGYADLLNRLEEVY